MPHPYYLEQRAEIMKTFDRTAPHLRTVLAGHYGDALAAEVARETRREYEALIPELPYIGGRANPATADLVGASVGLALYRVLRARGRTVEEIGRINYELAETHLSSLPWTVRLVRRLVGSLLFTRLGRGVLKRVAAESQRRRYPDGPVLYYVEGDGETFDFGIDYTVCPICSFFAAQGAGEFTRYVCLYDYPSSRLLSHSGLVRTTTLAEGGERCDFRFKRGRQPTNKQQTRISPSGKVPPEEDDLKILIYGAGVVGSFYAAQLHRAGHDVAILARGRRLADIRAHGIVLENVLTGQRSTTRIPVVEGLAPEDAYDLVMVVMRKNQVAAVLPALAANRHTPNVLFVGNNAAGPGELVAALGRERVLMGFGGVGGVRQGHVIRYVTAAGRGMGLVVVGELDGGTTPRLQRIVAAMGRAGIPVEVCPEIDAWLKTHVALVGPLAGALAMAGGDNYRLARTRDGIVLAVRGVREGFRVLQALGIPITPPQLRRYAWIPEPLLVPLLQQRLATEAAEIALVGHANAAPDEMRHMTGEFMALARTGAIPTPVLERLYTHLDPAAPPAPEGSAEIPLDWRPLWVGLGIAAALACLMLWLRFRRRGEVRA